MLTERQKRILATLIAHDEAVTGRELANALGVSLRTVQTEVSNINRTDQLILSTNKGYRINGTLTESQVAALEPSREVPIEHIMLRLITKHDGELTVDDLSESLFISSPVVERHIRALRHLIEPFQLKLVRRGGLFSIEGREIHKRKLIGMLVAEEANTSLSSFESISTYFDDMDIDRVRHTVLAGLHVFGYHVKQGYEQNLITSIAIALFRMRSNSYITGDPLSPKTADDATVRVAREICRLYASHRPITPGEGDIEYLASLFSGQIEKENEELGTTPTLAISNFVRSIEEIVNSVFDLFMLHIESSHSIYNFSMHVQALIERSRSDQITNTEALENIKMSCPFIYELALLISKRISDVFGITIQDGEVGFICIHVGMLIETTLVRDKLRIALMCDRYQGISERLRNEIEQHFSDVAIVTELEGKKDWNALSSIDLVITTRKNLPTNIPIVLISPFFTTTDYLKIENAIGLRIQKKQSRHMRMLLEPFFSSNLFRITGESLSKIDVIRQMSAELQKEGIVNEQFADLVMQRENLSSTCFFNLFAIPHSIEMNARRTMVCVLLSKPGIVWDDARIHVVLLIAVCSSDRYKFLEIYDTLVKALCDETQVTRLTKARTLAQFLDGLVGA